MTLWKGGTVGPVSIGPGYIDYKKGEDLWRWCGATYSAVTTLVATTLLSLHFALENDITPIGQSVPDHFLTKFLRENNCVLKGAEDIQNHRQVSIMRLEQAIDRLEDGSVHFIATAVGPLSIE